MKLCRSLDNFHLCVNFSLNIYLKNNYSLLDLNAPLKKLNKQEIQFQLKLDNLRLTNLDQEYN